MRSSQLMYIQEQLEIVVNVVEKNQDILEKFSAHVLMSRDIYSGTSGECGECGGEELEEVHSCFLHVFCSCATVT
jgi:hypothetical protein